MVGEGHLRKKLEAFANEHPHLLTVLPYERERDVLGRLYEAADVFLAPCPYETFGLAAVEAMSHGTPVVGAGAGAIGELIHDTGGGSAFEAGHAEMLTAALIDCLERSVKLGGRAQEAVKKRYLLDQTMPGLIDTYEMAVLPARALWVSDRPAELEEIPSSDGSHPSCS